LGVFVCNEKEDFGSLSQWNKRCFVKKTSEVCFFVSSLRLFDAEESFWAKCLYQRSDPADQHERKE